MRGNDEVIALLGELLSNELTAINQYLLHAATCERWGSRCSADSTAWTA